jgi:hypothetical protein
MISQGLPILGAFQPNFSHEFKRVMEVAGRRLCKKIMGIMGIINGTPFSEII